MKKINYLLFILFFTGHIFAQEHTITYNIGIFFESNCNQNPISIEGGTFQTGQSFIIPAQDVSSSGVPNLQELYDAIVGTEFIIDSGALTEDIAIQVNLTEVGCDGFYVNPDGSGEPLFIFLQVIVIVDGVPQINDYYFETGKYARVIIPKSQKLTDLMNTLNIDANDLGFGYHTSTGWTTDGLTVQDNASDYTLLLEHFSKFGGGKGNVVSVNDEKISGIPTKFDISQNYPNPFNPTTNIQYSIPEEGFVTLKVFNVLGSEVAELVNENKSSGVYEATFDASQLTSGIYFYTITYNNMVQTKKMLLIK